jgi:hypothetical protein
MRAILGNRRGTSMAISVSCAAGVVFAKGALFGQLQGFDCDAVSVRDRHPHVLFGGLSRAWPERAVQFLLIRNKIPIVLQVQQSKWKQRVRTKKQRVSPR